MQGEFLEELLDDLEKARLAPLPHYLERYPTLSEFVQAEYQALTAPLAAAHNTTSLNATLHQSPDSVGRYRIKGVLGQGGMGTVLEAHDPELRRRVVVKCLRPDLGRDTQAKERLRREARVLGQLGDPHLTQVIDVVEEHGRLYLVLAFHDGQTLGSLIEAARVASAAGGGTPWLTIGPPTDSPGDALRKLVGFFATTARALGSAHRAGIVHRDLKPHNLMVTPEGSPIVLDFGLAKARGDQGLTVAGELVGTPLYMAPEQVDGRPVDARTDVYALGVTMYEALVLVHPFAGRGHRQATFARIQRGDATPLRSHRRSMPRDLEAVVLRAMDLAPNRRYPDMDSFARDLQRFLDMEPTEARPVSGVGRAWRRMRRRPALAVGGALGLACGALALWAISAQSRLAAVRSVQFPDPPPGAPTAWVEDYRRVVEQVRRSMPQDGERLVLLHPRGDVLPVAQLTWHGLAPRGLAPEERRFRFTYTYRVEVFDGLSLAASADVASGDAAIQQWELPPELASRTTGTLRWQVRLVGCDEVTVDDPAQPLTPEESATLAALRQVTLADLQRLHGAVSAEFRVVAAPGGFQPRSGLAERLRALGAAGLWSDLLLQGLAGDSADLGREQIGLLRAAAERLGDLVLADYFAQRQKTKAGGR